jgi:hypothetical protein
MKEALETSLQHIDVLLQIFAVIVAVGVLGEAVFGVRHVLLSRRLRVIEKAEDLQHRLTIAGLQRDGESLKKTANDAEQKAEGFRLQIAQANERAANAEKEVARLNELAERERLARIKIEEKLAPRSLGQKQQGRIASELKTFAGQEFDVFTHRLDDPEAVNFSVQLVDILRAAGWVRNGKGGQRWWMTEGVFVGVPKNASTRTTQAVGSLVSALSAEGILAANHNPYPEEGDKETIPIIVAKKP